MDTRIAHHPPLLFDAIEKDRWTQPFWDAAARRELRFACCGECGAFRMPPTPFCPQCHSQDVEWVLSEGPAILHSYTVVDRAIIPQMEDNLPYVPAIVEFPEAQDVRLITNIVGSPIGALRIGASVHLHWADGPGGQLLPVFAMNTHNPEGIQT